MRHTSRILFWNFTAALLAAPVSLVYAQSGSGPSGCSPGEFCNPLAYKTLGDFLKALLDLIIQLAFPVIVVMIVVSGFLFVSAQGKPEKLETARRAILWTLIGAAIILGAFVISIAIKGTVEEVKKNALHTERILS